MNFYWRVHMTVLQAVGKYSWSKLPDQLVVPRDHIMDLVEESDELSQQVVQYAADGTPTIELHLASTLEFSLRGMKMNHNKIVGTLKTHEEY